MKKGFIFIIILIFSLILLTYSFFQVMKASLNPTLQVEREIFTSANNLIDVTGNATFSAIKFMLTSFENSFINYTDITPFADDPDVLNTRFVRPIGKAPYNIESLNFLTIVNNTDTVVSVNYTFKLMREYLIKEKSTLVFLVYTNLTGTKLSLIGEDFDGKTTYVTFDSNEAYKQYFLYVKPISGLLKTVKEINVTHVCQPEGFLTARTYFRILNIFDERPSIDSKSLVQGQLSLRFNDIEFPHTFIWKQLNPLNMTISIRLLIHPKSEITFNTLNYLWKIPDHFNATIVDAFARFRLGDLIEAPLTKASIIVEKNKVLDIIDVKEKIDEAFSNQSIGTIVDMDIPNDAVNGRVEFSYLYWASPWIEMALLSVAIIILDSIVILISRRCVQI